MLCDICIIDVIIYICITLQQTGWLFAFFLRPRKLTHSLLLVHLSKCRVRLVVFPVIAKEALHKLPYSYEKI